MKRFRSLIAFLSFCISFAASAYPIFYTCDSNGHANDVVDTKEVRSKVMAALTSPTSDSEIAAICQGEEACFSVLRQALLLTQVSAQAAGELFDREVEKIKANKVALEAELKQDASISETGRNLIVMANAVNDCRKGQMGALTDENGRPFITANDFAAQNREKTPASNGYDVFIQHGVDNEYHFVSGVGKSPDGDHKQDYDQIGNVIIQAVASNLDPYMALAIAFLETGEAKPPVLDLSPSIQMMGCKTTNVAKFNDEDQAGVDAKEGELRASGQPFIYTWGTFSTFTPDGGNPDSHANAKTREIFSQMQRTKGKDLEPIEYDGPSLACFQNEGGFLAKPDGSIIKSYNPDYKDETFKTSKACCMRIPYASYTAFSAMANIYARDAVGGKDPMTALQHYNGNGVIGLTEKKGIGAFRYGLLMREDPQYGAQGMDFVLNSFMNNPLIRFLVDRAEKRFDTRPKSLICSGKSPGTYAVDSEKFVNRQLSMKRLRTVVGKTWAQLANARHPGKPSLSQQMIGREYEFVTSFLHEEKGWVDYPSLTPTENAQLRAAAIHLNGITDPAAKWEYYQKAVYPYRNTLGRASKKSWARLTDTQVLGDRERIQAAPSQNEYDRIQEEKKNR